MPSSWRSPSPTNPSFFYYSLSYLNNLTRFVHDYWSNTSGLVPVVRFDWRIGSDTCTQAQLNLSTYACRDNTDCIDYATHVGGYLCQCKDGYYGNPYIGCLDINECLDDPCEKNSVCINTPGHFRCSCPRWYDGDGRKNGKGCRPCIYTIIFIGLSSGLLFIVVILTCLFWSKKLQLRKDQKHKAKLFKRNGGLLLQKHLNEGIQRKTILFSIEELEKATDNFNKSRIIGQGGQGKVYKGMLPDGKIIAIKKSKIVNKDQLEQFINEVVILSHINHRNVVKLLGCCLETEVPQLVYEYMPNGTLFDLIHDPKTEFPVLWRMRLKMAADIAGALMYLHSAISTPIYHRDIKSSNILLDEKYVVKLSDFGISRFVANDHTHLTTNVKGTFGYFDPEYYQTHQFTEKSDVYSFGVVLLELLTGLRPVCGKEDGSLVTRFLDSIEEDSLDSILDSRVAKEDVHQEMITVAFLAQRCLNLNGKMRPTMKEVTTNLESLSMSPKLVDVDDKYGEKGVGKAKSLDISNHEYTWTGNEIGETSSTTDAFIQSNHTIEELSVSDDDFSY